jgi:hypothetical protein
MDCLEAMTPSANGGAESGDAMGYDWPRMRGECSITVQICEYSVSDW